MKKNIAIISILLVIVSSLTGCFHQEKTAKELFVEGMNKDKEIKSYSFNSNAGTSFDLSKAKLDNIDNPLEGSINNENNTGKIISYLHLIPTINMQISGMEQIEPYHFEANINTKVDINGMTIPFGLPLIITNHKLYLKLPEPYRYFLPTLDKDYISLDLVDTMNQIVDVKNNKDIDEILSELNDEAFMKEKSNDYKISDGSMADHVISINITKENLKPFLQTVLATGLPLYIEQMEKNPLNNEQKKSIDKIKSDMKKNEVDMINEWMKKIIIHQLKITNLYDKEGFKRRSIIDIDMIINTSKNGLVGLKLNIDQSINDINGNIQFNLPIPKDDQVLDLKNLQKENTQ